MEARTTEEVADRLEMRDKHERVWQDARLEVKVGSHGSHLVGHG